MTEENNTELADQSLSSEIIANEIRAPSIISNNKSNSSSSSKNSNTSQLIAPNNAEEQQVQPQQDEVQLQEQLIEEPKQNVFIRCAKSVGTTIYTAMYNAGGFLADLFGITTPRYAYAIHEYEKHQERMRQRQIELESEANGENLNDIENPVNSLEPDHAL